MRKAKFIFKPNGIVTTLEENISDEHIKLLTDYYKEVNRIIEIFPDSSLLNMSIRISVRTGENVKSSITLPSEKDIITILHLIRPILLKKERLHFGKISNILFKTFNNEDFKLLIQNEKDMFFGNGKANSIQLNTNGKNIDSDEILMMYLNAYEYHRDIDKQEYFINTFGDRPDSVILYFLYNVLIEKVNAMIGLGKIISFITYS